MILVHHWLEPSPPPPFFAPVWYVPGWSLPSLFLWHRCPLSWGVGQRSRQGPPAGRLQCQWSHRRWCQGRTKGSTPVDWHCLSFRSSWIITASHVLPCSFLFSLSHYKLPRRQSQWRRRKRSRCWSGGPHVILPVVMFTSLPRMSHTPWRRWVGGWHLC